MNNTNLALTDKYATENPNNCGIHILLTCSWYIHQALKIWCFKNGTIFTFNGMHTMEYFSATKKNEIMLFAATWMDPGSIILSEVSQRKTKLYNSICMWNLKNDTNKLIYKVEIDLQK